MQIQPVLFDVVIRACAKREVAEADPPGVDRGRLGGAIHHEANVVQGRVAVRVRPPPRHVRNAQLAAARQVILAGVVHPVKR